MMEIHFEPLAQIGFEKVLRFACLRTGRTEAEDVYGLELIPESEEAF